MRPALLNTETASVVTNSFILVGPVELQPIAAAFVLNKATLYHHFEPEKKIVVPIAGKMQFHEVGRNDAAVSLPFEQSSLEEKLGSSFRRCLRLPISRELAMECQRPKRNQALRERGNRRCRPCVAVPSTIRPLPFAQPLSQDFGAFIGEPQC